MRRPLLSVLAVGTLVMSIAGAAAPGAAAEQGASQAESMVLGVYWPETLGFPGVEGEARWAEIDSLLDSLEAHHVNTIWLNGSAAKVHAEYARRAAERGIRLVAAVGNIHTEVKRLRDGYERRVEQVLRDWGDAPGPLAWGIGDEPYTAAMADVAACAQMWQARQQPVVLVDMPRDLPSAIELVPLDFIATDVYPFFGEGCPNGPNTQSQSQAYILDVMDKLVRLTDYHRVMPGWYMGGIFQNAFGPCRADAEGNLVVEPGGNLNFRMPTPAEVHWQIWTALAGGARGIIMFTLFFYDQPKVRPLKGDWGLADEYNTGAPGGMLYPDGRATPQYEALGACYARIARSARHLQSMVPAPKALTAFHAKGWPPIGDCVRNFLGERDGRHYVVVVNGNLTAPGTVPVNVRRRFTSATDLCSGEELAAGTDYSDNWAPIGQPFRQIKVELQPGSGTVLLLHDSNENEGQ